MLFEHIPTHAPDVLGKLQRDMELIEKWGMTPRPKSSPWQERFCECRQVDRQTASTYNLPLSRKTLQLQKGEPSAERVAPVESYQI